MKEVFIKFCGEFAELCKASLPAEEAVVKGWALLQRLLDRPDITADMLGRLLKDRTTLHNQILSTDPNDINLYRASDGLFSVRVFIWEPDKIYPVHDHGAWGIVSCLLGKIRETKYNRLDDGAVPGFAKLEIKKQNILTPKDNTFVFTLNDGIHQMEALDGLAMSIHAYGPPVRKGYLQYFQPDKNKVTKIYPSQTKKRILAARALKAMGAIFPELSCENILEGLEEIIKKEL